MNQLESDLARYIIQQGSVNRSQDARGRRSLLESENDEEIARELMDILGPYEMRVPEIRVRVDFGELKMYLVGWLGLLESELGNIE